LALGVVSVGCLIGSHLILKRRNVALVAAYKLLNEAYKKYRARVVEEHGADRDYMYAHGIYGTNVTETVVGEDGKKAKVKTTVLSSIEERMASPYAIWFGPGDEEGKGKNWNYKNDPIHDAFFLKQKQNEANNLLCSRGHVVLNEVYEMLGFDHTGPGCVVGWVLNDHENRPFADGYIDFDLANLYNHEGKDFKKTSDKGILLDFNVDGVVWDLI
jgi:hypothetical protein